MDDAVLARLRCPLCAAPLARAGAAARCPAGHSFDVARQGYLNLATGRPPHPGDTAEMVAARAGFLAAGHYDLISDVLAEAARRILPASATAPAADAAGHAVLDPPDDGRALVVDAGVGTGRHLAAVLDAVPQAVGLGLDVSKPALRRAARAHPRAGAALADLWRPLPLPDAGAALILNVFAPRNAAEYRRALRPDGALLVVTPAADHLGELVAALGLLRVDPDKAERVAASLGAAFQPGETVVRRRTLALRHDEARTLVTMGPSAWHTDPDRLAAAVAALPTPTPVTVAVTLTVHRPR